MAYWNNESQKIESFAANPIDGYPGWVRLDCGCCNGIQWSAGYEAIECDDCCGSGVLCRHNKSGVIALYPGGPFRGIMKLKEV